MTKKKPASKIWDNKFVWAIMAVIASLLLWVYVTMTEGDLIPETYNVQVVFIGADSLRDKENLILTDISATTVSVRLEGTRSEISALNDSDITAVIDLSKVTPVEGQFPMTPTITFAPGVSKSTLTNIVVIPTTISYRLVRQYSKTIPLKDGSTGTVAEDFVAKSMIFDPVSITISGPESEIIMVESALVVYDREGLDRTVNFDSTFILVDKDGNEVPIGNMRLSQEYVDVTLPVFATKELPLSIDVVPGAGATEENIIVTFEPKTIVISGDADILAGYNKITIATVDLSSFGLSFEQTFTIMLNNDITNVTGITEAKVTIQVIGLETRKFTVTNISAINVAAGLTADIVNESVEVTVRGTAEALEDIKSNNIRIVVDMADSGTAAGDIERNARVYVDGFTGVGAVGEYPILIKLRS